MEKPNSNRCPHTRRKIGLIKIIVSDFLQHYAPPFRSTSVVSQVSLFYLSYELLFYPRYHLDQSSLLCRKPLLAKPMVMDVYQDYMLLTYRPFDVHIFHVKLFGELTPSGNPDLQVNAYLHVVFLLFFVSNVMLHFLFEISSIKPALLYIF